MPVIGFRCFPDAFSYVVMDGTQKFPKTVAKERLDFPADASRGQKLVWLRKQVFELLEKHKVGTAAMKTTEPNAKQKSIPRAEAEGVVREAVYAKIREECISRIKVQLAKHIRGFSEKPRYLHKILAARRLEELNTAKYEEAALVAISILPP